MDMVRNEVRQLNPEQYTETKALEHASQQARQRNYQDFLIVDVDAHHYESESYKDVFSYIENPVIKMEAMDSMSRAGRSGFLNSQVGYQSLGGRMTRHKNRADLQGTQRRSIATSTGRSTGWTPWASTTPACSRRRCCSSACIRRSRSRSRSAAPITTGCASASCAEEPRIVSMLYLPFNDPEWAYRTVRDFGDKKGVVGFMVTSPRYKPVHDNAYMKTYELLEEMGKPISFHAAYSWDDRALATTNRFISVHSLGFMWFNMIHMTNWVVNGIPERFPKLKTMWIESRPHLGLLPDAAARPLLHDAHVGLSAAQAQAERIHAGDVLLVAADGGAGRSVGPGGDLQDDQGRDATGVVVRLSALGLRPAERASTTCRS